ncbi:MAG: 8-oxoguanine DNA glycosylase [Roseovarius sp.]
MSKLKPFHTGSVLQVDSKPTSRIEFEVMPGVPYGREDQLLSPAYWKWRCRVGQDEGHDYVSQSSSLREEVGFCLLGGFGVRMEVNDAFFRHLKSHAVFEEGHVSEESILELLSQRIEVEGKLQGYRFPRQKAKRIAGAMSRLEVDKLTALPDKEFRDAICKLPGIGPKTASWIARNWKGANNVAILDIHVLRAGHFIGIFDRKAQLPRDYYDLETQFISFANLLDVPPSVLDAVIWSDMRIFGSTLVNQSGVN